MPTTSKAPTTPSTKTTAHTPGTQPGSPQANAESVGTYYIDPHAWYGPHNIQPPSPEALIDGGRGTSLNGAR